MKLQLRPHQIRGLDALSNHNKGQIIIPTGGGKTNIAVFDAVREFESETAKTIVVVSPRILLAEQLSSEFLEFITNADVMHVHSGETHHFSTTKPELIKANYDLSKEQNSHLLIFTTYNSLNKVKEADIEVDTIYFDEAHNSVKKNFFPATEHFASVAKRCYFFTATRKTSVNISKPGMNDYAVYGDIICRVSAPELVDGGYIIPPRVIAKKFEVLGAKQITAECDSENLLQTLDNEANECLRESPAGEIFGLDFNRTSTVRKVGCAVSKRCQHLSDGFLVRFPPHTGSPEMGGHLIIDDRR